MQERLLSVRDLVSLTGWAPITIYRKGSLGEIPGKVRIGKRSVRFLESAVEAWLNPQERETRERDLTRRMAEGKPTPDDEGTIDG